MIILKKIFKYSLWLIGTIIILLFGLYLFIQTETFNKWALNFAIDKLNNSENWVKQDNKITVESINGNLLKGLRINNILVTIKRDTLISIKYIDIKYDIWGLLRQEISTDYAVLNTPVLYLSKIQGSNDSLVWNYTNLFETTTDTTASSDFNWDIYVNSLKIENGKFKIFDSIPSTPLWALKWEKQYEFNFNKLDVTDIQLDLTGEYSKKTKKINLRNLSFISNSDFALNKLTFNADIDVKDTITDITDFQIITDRSDIKINKLTALSFNPLLSNAFDNYKNTRISFVLNVDRFGFTDLKYFIPAFDMFDSTCSLYINASGVLKNLDISSLTLNLPNSTINLNGNIKNLSEVDSMYLDITTSSKITASDINRILKIKSLPDFRRLGIILADITYKGNVLDFSSNFNIRTSGGNAMGQGHLNINDENYVGNVTTNNLNLASVFNDNKLKSNINISAEFKGTGYSPRTMTAGVMYKLRNSDAFGYKISSSSGTVHINRNNIVMNIKANSNSGNAIVAGKVNISDMKNPLYNFKGTMNNVDVSHFSGNISDKSNLNARFDINGSGSNLNNLAGKFNINVAKSYYSQYQIPITDINAELNLSGDSSTLQLTNNAIEVKADGKFSLYSLIDAVLYNISLVSNITEKKMYPDSNITNTDLSIYNHKDELSFNYRIVTRDSTELRKLLTPFGIIFNGDLNGTIKNSNEGFNSKSVVFIKNFEYPDTSIVINNLKSEITFSNNYLMTNEFDPLKSFKIDMDVNADKIMFGMNKLDSIKTNINLEDSKAKLIFKGKMDSVKYASLKGNVIVEGEEIILNVDSLYAKYNTYDFMNNNKWTLSYIPQREISINQLGLKSRNMVLNVKGIYSLTGSSDIKIEGDNVNFGQIYEILRPFDTTLTGEKNLYPVQGELKKLIVSIDGTKDDANVILEIQTNTLQYDSTGIGTISGTFTYKDRVLSPDILFTNNGDKGSLKIKGNVPFNDQILETDTTTASTDNPAELHLTADNFEIQYFTKLIPGIGDLQGILNGKIDANGTYLNPNLKGELTMMKGKYFLDFTGMYYNYDFRISTENSKLLIDKISIFNPDDDTKHIDLSGTIDFKGYTLNDIDLTTRGDMVLLDKSNKENKLGLKGYILGGIGTPPITIKGNLDKLNIKGQFLVKEATIASLPDSRNGYQKSENNIVYRSSGDSIFVNDTLRKRITLEEYESINPFMRNKFILIDTLKRFSILKMLALDLSVKTEKNMNISIDFNNLTRDRLFGEIMADIRIRSRNGRITANGEANVVGNSYYRFYRDFKVKESKIVFRGPIDKPELDIRAVYVNTKSTEQFGTITSSPIQVILTVKGEPTNPEITLKLYENGTEMQGNDATTDAITFLLFGKYKNELSASESQSVATGIGSTVGSLYVTSFFGQVLRDMVPFIKDAELNYTEGGLQNTNVNVSSDIFGANVTVGSRVIDNNAYLEFNVEYPLNDIVKINLPEKVILHFAREQLNSAVITNMEINYSTGLKVVYKFKF